MLSILIDESPKLTYDIFKDFGIPIASFILSVIVSIIAASHTAKREYGYYKTNLMAGYFNSIFNDIIVEQLPIALTKIDFENGQLNSSFEEVTDLLMTLLDKALFFSYFSKDFYSDITDKVIQIEDYLVDISNEVNIPLYQQEKYKLEIENYIRALYETLYNFYISKS